ncbi:MAG TPA: DUF4232 domain-containing protein [Actinocrinis sp.]|nr:DUF4232 domain-containing protein [Actinocrinis sp.]
MNTKQITARRAVAFGGVCLSGLMLAGCQSGLITTTAVGGPTSVSTAGSQVTLGGGQGGAAATPTASGGGSSTGSAGTGGSGTNSGGGSGSGSSTGQANPPAPPAPTTVTACTNSQVKTVMGQRNSGDANFDVTLVFTNISSKTCTLTGYAGASVDYPTQSPLNAARQMAAYLGGDEVDSTPPTVTLYPGDSASDLLNWNPGTTSANCLDGPGTAKLLLTAPGTTNTLTAATNIGGVCNNFSITPVVPGSNGQKS